MINLLLANLIIISFVIGCAIGYKIDYLQRKLSELREHLKNIDTRQAPTVTMGRYDKVDEYNKVNTDSEVGIVEVKTPQLLEWEEMQRQQKEIENV